MALNIEFQKVIAQKVADTPTPAEQFRRIAQQNDLRAYEQPQLGVSARLKLLTDKPHESSK